MPGCLRLRLTVLIALLAPVWLAACATGQPALEPVPPFVHHSPVPKIEPVEPLAISPAMQGFISQSQLSTVHGEARLQLLNQLVGDVTGLGFRYDDALTLTAAEAFDARAGNCLGFSNLFVALARNVGLKARFQEVIQQPDWYSRDTTVLVPKHVNVVVEIGTERWAADYSGLDTGPGAQRRKLTDLEAKGLFYSNLGAEALVRGDLGRAWALLRQAVMTAPELADPWVNLGVVYSRNGQPQAAATMYRNALALNPDQYSAMANLYQVYVDNGEMTMAADLGGRVERYRRRNPYYLLYLSDEAVEQQRFADSLELLEQALDSRPEEHLFHYALARTRWLTGDTLAAETSFARARELAPPDALVDYERPLSELVLQN